MFIFSRLPRKTLKLFSVASAILALLLVASYKPAYAIDSDAAAAALHILDFNPPLICRNQDYALCAGKRCLVFNDVAYCTCDTKHGDSISSAFQYNNNNVCTVNAQGQNNAYLVSTFSPPPGLTSLQGDKAVYNCPRTSQASYAKCDGGICFKGTAGSYFPNSNLPVGTDQIVCSCPVEKENPIMGLAIIGPYPCQPAFFNNCDPSVATNTTGSYLYDGTTIGSTQIATLTLQGSNAKVNVCTP